MRRRKSRRKTECIQQVETGLIIGTQMLRKGEKAMKERKIVGDIEDDDKHSHRTFKLGGRTGHEDKTREREREKVDRYLITPAPHRSRPT